MVASPPQLIPLATRCTESQGITLFASDLLNAMSTDEIRDGLNLKSVRERKWTIQACSSKDGEGLEEGFKWIMANMRQKDNAYR